MVDDVGEELGDDQRGLLDAGAVQCTGERLFEDAATPAHSAPYAGDSSR
jgi:hypothetical protein